MKSLKVLGLAAVVVASASCVPNWARNNETGLIMEVARIEGVRGGTQGGGQGAAILFSDVSVGGATINDDAIVTVNVYRKNPNVTSTSALEHVRLESYQVQFFRSDGRNVEGLDVPYRITGPLNSVRFHTPTGTDEVELEADLVVVRQTAKRDPPLVNLRDTTSAGQARGRIAGEGIIFTTAEITIYARQVTTGEPLQATGHLQVAFSDWIDE